MAVEFAAKIDLGTVGGVVVAVRGKELALAHLATSQRGCLILILRKDEGGLVGHGGRQCATDLVHTPIKLARRFMRPRPTI